MDNWFSNTREFRFNLQPDFEGNFRLKLNDVTHINDLDNLCFNTIERLQTFKTNGINRDTFEKLSTKLEWQNFNFSNLYFDYLMINRRRPFFEGEFLVPAQYFSFPSRNKIFPFFSSNYFYYDLPFWLHKDLFFLFFKTRYVLQLSSYFYLINCFIFFLVFFFFSIFFFKDIYLLYDCLPFNPFTLRYNWSIFFKEKAYIFYQDSLFFEFKNAFDFEEPLKIKFNKFDFGFFDTYQFFDHYFYQKTDNNFYFSDLFFFNSLQVNDFHFLHRDFYQFYPIFKYMLIYNILINKFSAEEIIYLRNCILLSERLDLFSLKQEIGLKHNVFHSNKITSQDFDSLYLNIYSLYFDRSIVKKFFIDFVDKQIFFQQVDEDFFSVAKKFNSWNLSPISEDQKLLLFYTVSKGFNGILEMLHFYNKVTFPKRFLFLQDIFSGFNNNISSDGFFWKFWFFPKFFLNASFYNFSFTKNFLYHMNYSMVDKNKFWLYNLNIFENFFILRKNFSSSFFWNTFFNLDDFVFQFFNFAGKSNNSMFFSFKFFSFRYSFDFFKKFLKSKFFFNDTNSFFFSFFGTLFFPKIVDFYFQKTYNKFDLLFFFENKNFDFIIFNHVYNRFFFFQILNSLFKLRNLNCSISSLINQYEFFFVEHSFKHSIYFFNRNFFKQVPSLYVNFEKELIFFFDKIWNFFFFLESYLNWSPFTSFHKQDSSIWFGDQLKMSYNKNDSEKKLNKGLKSLQKLDIDNSDITSGFGLFFFDIFLFYICFFSIVLFLNLVFEFPDFFPTIFWEKSSELIISKDILNAPELLETSIIKLKNVILFFLLTYILIFPDYFDFFFNGSWFFLFFLQMFPFQQQFELWEFFFSDDFVNVSFPSDVFDFWHMDIEEEDFEWFGSDFFNYEDYDLEQDDFPWDKDYFLRFWVTNPIMDDHSVFQFNYENFFVYEQLGFTSVEDFFGQDIFPLYTDFDNNFFFPFSDNWDTFRFKSLDQFQTSFFHTHGFYFDDNLFDGFFENFSNKFININYENTFPLYSSNKGSFFNGVSRDIFNSYPDSKLNFYLKDIFSDKLNINDKKLYSLIFDDFLSFYESKLKYDLTIDQAIRSKIKKNNMNDLRSNFFVDFFNTMSWKNTLNFNNKVPHYDFFTNNFYFEEDQEKVIIFDNFCLNYSYLASLYTKPFINNNYFNDLIFLKYGFFSNNLKNNTIFNEFFFKLDQNMTQFFFDSNFSGRRRRFSEDFYPETFTMLLSDEPFYDIIVPRLGVMDWTFFFDFYKINNWNFNVVFSDDFEDDFLFFDLSSDLDTNYNMVNFNVEVIEEILESFFYSFFDFFFDSFLAFFTFIFYFIYTFFPVFFDGLLYDFIYYHTIWYFWCLFFFDVYKKNLLANDFMLAPFDNWTIFFTEDLVDSSFFGLPGKYAQEAGLIFFLEYFIFAPEFFFSISSFDFYFGSFFTWFFYFYDLFLYNFNSSFLSAFYYFDYDFLILFDFSFFVFFFKFIYFFVFLFNYFSFFYLFLYFIFLYFFIFFFFFKEKFVFSYIVKLNFNMPFFFKYFYFFKKALRFFKKK